MMYIWYFLPGVLQNISNILYELYLMFLPNVLLFKNTEDTGKINISESLHKLLGGMAVLSAVDVVG